MRCCGEVLAHTRHIGIAQVVVRGRQHAAALLPAERMLQPAAEAIDFATLLRR